MGAPALERVVRASPTLLAAKEYVTGTSGGANDLERLEICRGGIGGGSRSLADRASENSQADDSRLAGRRSHRRSAWRTRRLAKGEVLFIGCAHFRTHPRPMARSRRGRRDRLD